MENCTRFCRRCLNIYISASRAASGRLYKYGGWPAAFDIRHRLGRVAGLARTSLVHLPALLLPESAFSPLPRLARPTLLSNLASRRVEPQPEGDGTARLEQ
jgi:hypothetical protein